MKILISDAFDPSLPEKLEVFGEVTDDKDRLAEMNVVLVRSKTKCTREYIDQATNLRLIIRGGVGLDNIDVEYARSKGIQVFNTAEASAVAVAELAFALMLSVPTRLVEGHVGMKDRQWYWKRGLVLRQLRRMIAFVCIGVRATVFKVKLQFIFGMPAR